MRPSHFLAKLFLIFLPIVAVADCPDRDLVEHYARVAPQVVLIEGGPGATALGSGFIYRPKATQEDAWVISNAHVVSGERDLSVRINGQRIQAQVLAKDDSLDLVVLSLDGALDVEGLTFRRQPPEVGERVWALGSPFGLEGSLASGFLSAVGRFFPEEPAIPYLQLDMALNPGGSGGPLLDGQGRLLGLNTQVVGRENNQAGLAFAIPAWVVERFLEVTLENQGEAGYLGLYLVEGEWPLMVRGVVPDSPADRAGIKAGDRLLPDVLRAPMDGRFQHRLLKPLPGERLALQLMRGKGQNHSLILLAEPYSEGNRGVDWLGIQARRHVDGGVAVVAVDRANAALEAGDRLLFQGARRLSHPFDLSRPSGESTPILLERGGRRFYLAVEVSE